MGMYVLIRYFITFNTLIVYILRRCITAVLNLKLGARPHQTKNLIEP
jgi:hypothetical protein